MEEEKWTRMDIHIFQYEASLVSKWLIIRSCTPLRFYVSCLKTKYIVHQQVYNAFEGAFEFDSPYFGIGIHTMMTRNPSYEVYGVTGVHNCS